MANSHMLVHINFTVIRKTENIILIVTVPHKFSWSLGTTFSYDTDKNKKV